MTPFGVVMSDPLGNRLAPALGILTDVDAAPASQRDGADAPGADLAATGCSCPRRFRRERAGFRLRLPQCLQLNQAGTRFHDGRLAPA